MGNRVNKHSKTSSPELVLYNNGVYKDSVVLNANDANVKHNLTEVLEGVNEADKKKILKSGIPSECVVFENILSVDEIGNGEETVVLSQRLPKAGSDIYDVITTARLLVQYGAIVFECSNELIMVHYYGPEEFKTVLRPFVESCDVNASDDLGNTALHLCCNHQWFFDTSSRQPYKHITVDLLLRGGASVNSQNYQGKTPFHLCVSNLNAPLGLKLLKNGANMTVPDINGSTALHSLVSSYDWRHSNFKRFMLCDNTNPNVRNSYNMTPLHYAYKKTQKEELDIVLRPLWDVSWDKYLLRIGADTNIQNNKNMVPIQLLLCDNADDSLHLETIKLHLYAGLNISHLENYILRINEAHFNFMREKDLDVLQLMLECGGKPIELSGTIGLEMYKLYRTRAMQYIQEPLTLMRCAANVVRVSLRPNAIIGVEGLNLPRDMKPFLNFNAREYMQKIFDFDASD